MGCHLDDVVSFHTKIHNLQALKSPFGGDLWFNNDISIRRSQVAPEDIFAAYISTGTDAIIEN
ncbi:unnamed protein product, partial [Rotaria sp. Silwood2]